MTIPHAEPKFERQIRGQNHRIAILDYLETHKSITLKNCQEELGMPRSVAEYSLRYLKTTGHLKQEIVNAKARYTRTKREFIPKVYTTTSKALLKSKEVKLKKVKVKEVIPKVEDTRTVVKVNEHTTQYFLSRRKQEPATRKKRSKSGMDYGIRSNMYMFDGV